MTAKAANIVLSPLQWSEIQDKLKQVDSLKKQISSATQTTSSQPLNSYFQPGVEPLQLSGLKLASGPVPYYYSLGADSTVPFVSLQGGGQTQKVFTWGESIVVMPGETVTVKSESYMKGDIQINSGNDPCVRPARISVPVALQTLSFVVAGQTFYYYKSSFPADVRLARRAYINFQLELGEVIGNATVYGKAKKHSFPAQQNISSLINIGNVNYATNHVFNSFTSVTQVPLGYGFANAMNDSLPMALTDQVEFIIGFWNDAQLEQVSFDPLVMYVIEY